jgi:hypothetical protein
MNDMDQKSPLLSRDASQVAKEERMLALGIAAR